jgi:hypothetical protein
VNSLVNPRDNHSLASLPAKEFARWMPNLEAVKMSLGQVLYESGGTLGHVYFPTSVIVTLIFVLANGGSGFRLKAALMMEGFNFGGPVLHLFLR